MANESVTETVDPASLSFLTSRPPGPGEKFDATFYADDEVPEHLRRARSLAETIASVGTSDDVPEGCIEQVAAEVVRLIEETEAWWKAVEKHVAPAAIKNHA